MAVKQTAGRDQLGDFAPQFAQLNDDVLFGEVWAREDEFDLKTRSIITVTCLVSKGLVDTSFQYHLASAKANGVTKEEMAAILTQLAFYAGWPNAWAAFRMEMCIRDSHGPVRPVRLAHGCGQAALLRAQLPGRLHALRHPGGARRVHGR